MQLAVDIVTYDYTGYGLSSGDQPCEKKNVNRANFKIIKKFTKNNIKLTIWHESKKFFITNQYGITFIRISEMTI